MLSSFGDSRVGLFQLLDLSLQLKVVGTARRHPAGKNPQGRGIKIKLGNTVCLLDSHLPFVCPPATIHPLSVISLSPSANISTPSVSISVSCVSF